MTPDSRNRPACDEPVSQNLNLSLDSTVDTDIVAEATAISALGGRIVDATHISAYAVELAVNNWKIGPLCHRDPVTKRILHERGKTPVPHLTPHGLHDFTTDIATISRWWADRPWNIGARVPDSMFVLDVDDLDALAALEDRHGKLPVTLTTISGRTSGGKHLYFRRPAGKLSHRRLPKGIEIKTSAGYVVQPPSIHPDSGQQYRRIEAPVNTPPAWLVELLRPEVIAAPRPVRQLYSIPRTGPSVADRFSAEASWLDILGNHGWQSLDADPEADGARFRHPTATSSWSATIKHGCLFVYSPNTPFTVTTPSEPHGYTKFRAYAVLNHGGDLSAAAKQLLTEVA